MRCNFGIKGHRLRVTRHKLQPNMTKDVRRVAKTISRTDGWKDGRTDGITHTRTYDCRFYSPPQLTSGDNYGLKGVVSIRPIS